MSVQPVSVPFVNYPEHLVKANDKRCWFCFEDPKTEKAKEWVVHNNDDTHPIHNNCATQLYFKGYINCSNCNALIDMPLKPRVGLFLHKYTDILIQIGGAVPVFIGAGIIYWRVIEEEAIAASKIIIMLFGVGLQVKKLFELGFPVGLMIAIGAFAGRERFLPEDVITLFTPIRVAGLVAFLSGIRIRELVDEKTRLLGQHSGAIAAILSGIVSARFTAEVLLGGVGGGIVIGFAGGFLTKKIVDFALKSLSASIIQ